MSTLDGLTDLVSSSISVKTPQAPQTTPGFLRLPTELHEHILTIISSDKGIDERKSPGNRALHSLSLTCKDLNLATNPFLYERMNIDTAGRPSLNKLVRTLCTKPCLALLIRHVIATPCAADSPHGGHIWGPIDPISETLDSAEAKVFHAKLRTGLHNTKIFNKLIDRARGEPCGGAEVMFLLVLATQLRSIVLQTTAMFVCRCPMHNGWGRALHAIWSDKKLATGAFAQLKSVQLDGLDYGDRHMVKFGEPTPEGSLRDLATVMSLPGLSKLTMRGVPECSSSDITRATRPFVKGPAALDSLEILQSQPSVQLMKKVLETCDALRDFRYEIRHVHFWHRYESIQAADYMATQDLESALRIQKDSLRSISITYSDDQVDQMWKYRPFMSFSDFKQLSHLEIDWTLLYLHTPGLRPPRDFLSKIMPASLTHIKVHSKSDLSPLADLMLPLIPLRRRGLQLLEISFPASKADKQVRNLLSRADEMPSMDRLFSIGWDKQHHDRKAEYVTARISLACWDLQAWPELSLEHLSATIRLKGVETIIQTQLQDLFLEQSFSQRSEGL
ncbi:unnamed protein product [Zymoseptoria tritici ST99CH_3D7]|uniref:Uncharacterized protein n=1 Tax=Zymoseptoria tritici (strain ST99CH_3D7) TaxID=1276538 RepID=A0A1X7S2Z9_ZYMT9|nr:unnamed protein product [Zymoseptoria tritici ST99CH_3D7]